MQHHRASVRPAVNMSLAKELLSRSQVRMATTNLTTTKLNSCMCHTGSLRCRRSGYHSCVSQVAICCGEGGNLADRRHSACLTQHCPASGQQQRFTPQASKGPEPTQEQKHLLLFARAERWPLLASFPLLCFCVRNRLARRTWPRASSLQPHIVLLSGKSAVSALQPLGPCCALPPCLFRFVREG